jgi:nucleoside-diphosphate-sugar epimerase
MNRSRMIAVLGATSQIAKGLIENYLKRTGSKLYLYARRKEKVKEFLSTFESDNGSKILDFEDFDEYDYDVIINCVGYGTPQKVIRFADEILQTTEKYDNVALNYLASHTAAMYINFSSGAVYGKCFEKPADENTLFQLKINRIGINDYYALSKIYSEAKHRSTERYNIADIRVFAYFSKYIDTAGKYFITELVDCLIKKKPFLTTSNDMVRDYTHPDDLFQLVNKCTENQKLNGAYDAFSKKPVSKFELLDYLKMNYGLIYTIKDNIQVVNATGNKSMYYSVKYNAEEIGYSPKYTSLESIDKVLRNILGLER